MKIIQNNYRKNQTDEGYICENCNSVFEYEDNKTSELNILKFENADIEWLRFVSANRNNQSIRNDYDIIIGPVANDKTMPVISLFFTGLYSEEETIKRLLPQKLQDQFVFKTEKALNQLNYVETIKKWQKKFLLFLIIMIENLQKW